MYDIKYEDGDWWITKDGKICDELPSFCDPVSAKIFIREMEEWLNTNITQTLRDSKE